MKSCLNEARQATMIARASGGKLDGFHREYQIDDLQGNTLPMLCSTAFHM